MRIVYFANNWVSWKIGAWLKSQGETFAAVVIHPEHKQKYIQELLDEIQPAPEQIIDATTLRSPKTVAKIKALNPDIGLSILFDYILKPEMINLFPQGVVNLHPSYLPYNRGQYPNVWSIVEGTPSGISLHYIDAGIDTGDLIAQALVPVDPVDTGKTLYHKLEEASVELFKAQWPLIKTNKNKRLPQNFSEKGTYHRTKDVEQIDEIDLEKSYQAKTLIDILRARTFPPYKGAYFLENGRKVYMRLELFDEEQT